jgi:hypothetical protein
MILVYKGAGLEAREMDQGEPSQRVIDQRLRNRITEALSYLSKGVDGARWEGLGEWFESFFDYFPYEGSDYRANSAICESEWTVLRPLIGAMQQAYRDTGISSDEELMASGWPERIAPLAQAALEVFTSRGRFSEESEEEAPSH